MNFFPTWQVWRLLHKYQNPAKYKMLTRLFHTKGHPRLVRLFHNLWTWLFISFAISILNPLAIGLQNLWLVSAINWLPRLIILLACLHFAVRVISVVGAQHTLGRYDLFFILPAGEFTSTFDILRAYRYPFDGVIRGRRALLAAIFLGGCALVQFTAFANPSLTDLLSLGATLLSGIFQFLWYGQTFIAALLIGILASRWQQRAAAQVSLIALFMALQGVMLLAAMFLSSLGLEWTRMANNPSGGFMGNLWLWALLLQPLLLVLCREAVNLILWQTVKRRLEA